MNKKICLFGALGMLTLAFAWNSQAQCTCVCEFPRSKQLVLEGKQAASTGTQYAFRPNFFRNCTGTSFCTLANVRYEWTISDASTAAFSVDGGVNSPQLVVVVTRPGKLEITCNITVTCGDLEHATLTNCGSAGARSFRVSN